MHESEVIGCLVDVVEELLEILSKLDPEVFSAHDTKRLNILRETMLDVQQQTIHRS